MLSQSFLYGYYRMLSLRFSLYVSLLLNLVLDKIGCWVCECWWRSDLFRSLEWFCIEGFALFFFFLGWDFGTIFPSSFSILILFVLLWLLEIMYLWEKNSKLYLLFLMTPRLYKVLTGFWNFWIIMELKMHFHIVVTLQVFDFFLFPNCHCFSCWPHIFGYLQYKIYIPKHLIGFFQYGE